MKTLNRRQLLGGLGAGAAALSLPWQRALADATGNDLRFLFVFNQGGWDPTHVFAPLFGNPNVDLEADAGVATYGDIPIVEHLTRPSVSEFFARHHARSLVMNGVGVRSLSHEICTARMLTGSSGSAEPDWGSQLGHARQAAFTLPHLVLGGPSMPGALTTSVARTGEMGQLDGLLSGDILELGDGYAGRPTPVQERILDRYMERRSAARAGGARATVDAALADAYDAAAVRGAGLKGVRYDMDFVPGGSVATQSRAAVDALSLGISRVVSVSGPQGWDTHANINQQQALWEGLFAGLLQLMEMLQAAPGVTEPSLADETVVVVLSEMGRTPRLNGAQGKDHWPHTSALMVGPGLRGGRVVGGYDDYYYGLGVDPDSGEVDEASQPLTASVLGATLLTLAGVDPGRSLRGVDPILGVLA